MIDEAVHTAARMSAEPASDACINGETPPPPHVEISRAGCV